VVDTQILRKAFSVSEEDAVRSAKINISRASIRVMVIFRIRVRIRVTATVRIDGLISIDHTTHCSKKDATQRFGVYANDGQFRLFVTDICNYNNSSDTRCTKTLPDQWLLSFLVPPLFSLGHETPNTCLSDVSELR